MLGGSSCHPHHELLLVAYGKRAKFTKRWDKLLSSHALSLVFLMIKHNSYPSKKKVSVMHFDKMLLFFRNCPLQCVVLLSCGFLTVHYLTQAQFPMFLQLPLLFS